MTAESAGPEPALSKEEPAWVSLNDFAARHAMSSLENGEGGMSLTRGDLALAFQPDGRRARIRGIFIWLQNPLQQVESERLLASVDTETVLDPLLRAYRHVPPQPVRTVVLDPGHGGHDSGAVGPDGLLEKDVVLDLALRLRKHLEGDGFRVHLTREDDRYLTLSERTQVAADLHADLFLSLHANGWHDNGVQGIETYVLAKAGYPSTNSRADSPSPRHVARDANRRDGANQVLGFHLQRRMIETTGAVDRGLRHARFQVLREAPCPAALAEVGFITHPGEAERLRDPAHRAQVTRALAHAVVDYARDAERARLVAW